MFKPSTLKQRESFYKNEFKIKKVKNYFKIKPQFLAVDLGTETGIIKNKNDLNKLKIIKADFKTLKQRLISYQPEDVYYDRNIYKNPNKCLKEMCFKKCPECKNWLGQELAFDLDANNIKCKCKKTKVCEICLNKAKTLTIKFYKDLKKDFKNIHIVYSGRGFHLIVRDKKTYQFSIKQRDFLNKKFKQYPIDPWVSKGGIRLMRLPYSLNALVSRITTPIKIGELKNFNSKKFVPKFLK